jgi:(p)ppGpp synthase/HD superfamily hydrolase
MVSLFNKAIIIAEKVHANQMDKKGYPYMSHVIDIASRVSHFGESYQIVGLLHDAIEDAEPTSFRSEIAKGIEATFNIEIINAIKAMTKVLGEDYYKSYLPRLKKDKIVI